MSQFIFHGACRHHQASASAGKTLLWSWFSVYMWSLWCLPQARRGSGWLELPGRPGLFSEPQSKSAKCCCDVKVPHLAKQRLTGLIENTKCKHYCSGLIHFCLCHKYINNIRMCINHCNQSEPYIETSLIFRLVVCHFDYDPKDKSQQTLQKFEKWLKFIYFFINLLVKTELHTFES